MSTTIFFDPLKALAEHESWLRTSLRARLANVDEVEEVMQEIAVAAANQAQKPQEIEKAGPWLYRVAMRQVLLFRRKAGRRRKLIDNVAVQCPTPVSDSSDSDPIQFLIARERQQQVRNALQQICERDRQLLMLKYVEGLSYHDIASRLGVTASAIQSRLHRARQELRRRLLEVTD